MPITKVILFNGIINFETGGGLNAATTNKGARSISIFYGLHCYV